MIDPGDARRSTGLAGAIDAAMKLAMGRMYSTSSSFRFVNALAAGVQAGVKTFKLYSEDGLREAVSCAGNGVAVSGDTITIESGGKMVLESSAGAVRVGSEAVASRGYSRLLNVGYAVTVVPGTTLWCDCTDHDLVAVVEAAPEIGDKISVRLKAGVPSPSRTISVCGLVIDAPFSMASVEYNGVEWVLLTW